MRKILMVTIYKTFAFDAAHFLPNVPEGHRCKQLHGHTYHVGIYLKGHLKMPEGWVMDYGDLKSILHPILNKLDHQLLNNVEGLENPTAEMLVLWLWNKIKPLIPELDRVELKETDSSGAIYGS
ncbi:6-carboxytetrahydropterin synthase QueD [Pedobacter sp. AW1-32]|uniref:6-carboxytetrahydropterin synthase QueD n=1 Tax=Pedobacter sp. AW1-32 TaxID=3383026 RepID=UPI003FF1528F